MCVCVYVCMCVCMPVCYEDDLCVCVDIIGMKQTEPLHNMDIALRSVWACKRVCVCLYALGMDW